MKRLFSTIAIVMFALMLNAQPQGAPQGQAQNGPRGGQGAAPQGAGAPGVPPSGNGGRGGSQRPASLSLTEIEFYELP